MNVSNLLSHDAPSHSRSRQATENTQAEQQRSHQYPTRHSTMMSDHTAERHHTPPTNAHLGNATAPSPYQISPASSARIHVTFELLFNGDSNQRARLPMRVQIFPHDGTESIVSTVKNFFGIYQGAPTGVSFEDDQGNTLIPRYENFHNDMVVSVRVLSDNAQPYQAYGRQAYLSASPIDAHRVPHLDEPLQIQAILPAQGMAMCQPTSSSGSQLARKRSASPHINQRSASAQKHRPQHGRKSRGSSVQGNINDLHSDGVNGYSSSDGAAGSVTGSRKARSEQLASAEISEKNIVEGGRRKRAKFESSELPLFVPPQVPAANSISSISPQRRSNGQDFSPFARPTQRTFAYSQPLQSPQSFGFGERVHSAVSLSGNAYALPPPVHHGHRLRDRTNPSSIATRTPSNTVPRTQGHGILPTPDPTIASCISDEDVALQLMRLGDASIISHGRTSASTLDDALSGRADAASSVTSDASNDSDVTRQPSLPQHRLQSLTETNRLQANALKRQQKHLSDGLRSFDSTEPSGDDVDEDYEYDDKRDGIFKSDPDDLVNEYGQPIKSGSAGFKTEAGAKKVRSGSTSHKALKTSKARPTGHSKKAKPSSLSMGSKAPLSPASLPAPSRKTSSASTLNFQHQLGLGEEDLSSKPRCQRCRKSKKGCDRQRPCQRCKDAGIGVEGCVSEDEGNGRKGRFGRHMGVSVKKDGQENSMDNDYDNAGVIHTGLIGVQDSPDKSKKRKR